MTPTDLANYVRCPHRVFLDKHGDPAAKLPPNAFTELLWAGGLSHEATIIDGLDVATVDTTLSYPERAAATHALMALGAAARAANALTHFGSAHRSGSAREFLHPGVNVSTGATPPAFCFSCPGFPPRSA